MQIKRRQRREMITNKSYHGNFSQTRLDLPSIKVKYANTSIPI
jgi:hypothetical protein